MNNIYHKIASTGLVLAALALVLRAVSHDDCKNWWRYFVVFLLFIGISTAAIVAIAAIWIE